MYFTSGTWVSRWLILIGLKNIDKAVKSLGTAEKKLHDKWFKIHLLQFYENAFMCSAIWFELSSIGERPHPLWQEKSLRPPDLFCMWDLVWARGDLVGSCLLLKKGIVAHSVVRLWWMCRKLCEQRYIPSTNMACFQPSKDSVTQFVNVGA